MASLDPETGLGVNNKSGYRTGTSDYYRDKNLKKLYGISLVEFTKMFEAQGFVCAICGSDEPNGKNFHVDHDHKTGKIRGILCGWCNTALGKFQESKEIMQKAAKYLERT